MRLIPACFIVFLFLLAVPVRADYQKAYNDYTFAYNTYRSAHDDYQISKSTYATYRTLTAQTDAINKLRKVLQTRNTLMSVYYDMLQEKLAETPNIAPESKSTFFNVKESEKKWLAEQQIKIDAAASLEDLNAVSADFEARYSQMDTETKQAIGSVLIAKTSGFSSRWDKLATDLSDELKTISVAGEDTSIGQRGIISARNKKDLATAKVDQAKQVLYPKSYVREIDLLSAQQRLIEAGQYLREGTNYLLEVVKGITG